MKPTNNVEKNIPSDTYLRVQLVAMNVQTQRSSETPMEYHSFDK